MNTQNIKAGDVVQINQFHGRSGWIGAFVLVTELKSFGVQGFVHSIKTHDEASRAYIRLPWKEVCRIGTAELIPSDEEAAHPTQKTA